jgi:K+-sensing histidine kinase KdpD
VTTKLFRRSWTGYAVSLAGITVATGVLRFIGPQINPTTVALVFVLLVLFLATVWGSGPAILAAVLGAVCFNFFFLPPIGTFTIAHPENWIALFAFLVTAITAGQLSARAKRRAEEAEAARREIERLYRELQDSFERASQAEALKQSERLKSALLDAVTHDLRTPLTSIKASVTTLLEEHHPATREPMDHALLGAEARKDMLEVINEEADRLDRFVEGLTQMARIEAGEMRLGRRWSSMGEIIATALERAEPRTRGHRIETRIEKELPAVRVDEQAVAEVVYTLVDNAAKYSPHGTVILVSAAANGDSVRLGVEDEGPGIPVEIRERVFDKFFRAMRDGDARGQQPAGSGMGLAIAKGIVEAHGGSIRIEDSAGGSGARFVVALPTGDDDATRAET